MFKKSVFTAALSFSILLLLVSSASAAISFVYSEGVWGRVDDGYDGIRFDVVGVIGKDPGQAWTGSGNSTRNQTLRRNPTVCTHDYDGDATLAEWTSYGANVYTGLGSHSFGPGACTSQGLFISEYIEGSTNNDYDAIEIYNNMGQNVDLSPFSIQIYNNGSATPSVDIPLDGYTILKDSTFVIARVNIPAVTENLTTILLSFTGNDAVALVRDYIADAGNPGPDGEDDSATGLTYGSGPTGFNPTVASWTTDTSPTIQNPPTGDWNQIRYGLQNAFSAKSGLAFQGITNEGTFEQENAFLAGKFCHVNNPINASNDFTYTNLTLDLYNVACGTGAVAPFPPERMTFVYPVELEETPNEGGLTDCKWPSTTPCADAVTFGQADAQFTCFYEGLVQNTYTVAIVGFMPVTADQDCSKITFDPDATLGIFISQEGTPNCGCLYAMVTESQPTAVELISFSAESVPEGVKVAWETATETDNLGFNLYRADSLISEKVQLNDTLILPNVPPGSPFGASYEFLDTGATSFQTYFYWLEDIDVSGVITLHGPVSVVRQ